MPNRVVYTFVFSDKFSRAARAITRATKQFAGAMRLLGRTARAAGRVVAGSFGLMKKAAIGLQTSMAPLIASFAGIAGAIKFFTVGAGFQDALADFSAITRTTGDDLKFVRDESLRLGKAARVNSAEVATAFKLVASAQSELLEDTDALSGVVENVLLLKNAAGETLELAGAASVLTKSLNAFNAPADQAGRFVNVLAAGAAIGASEILDIGAAMKEAGPAAQLTKTGFEETNAALQVLAKKGAVVGSQAGTKLRVVMTKLETSLRKDLRPSVIGLEASLATLGPKLEDTTFLKKLFGEEALGAGLVLASNTDLLRKWTQEFTGTNVAQEQANIQLSTMSSRMRGLGVVVANKVIAMFERLTPQLEIMIEDFGKFLDTISPEDLAEFAEGLQVILASLIGIAKASAAAARFLGPVIQAGSNLATSAVAGVSDLGTLITGGELSATTSASFKNAQRIERSRTDINVNLNDPGNAVRATNFLTTGKVSGLKVGVNNVAAEGA